MFGVNTTMELVVWVVFFINKYIIYIFLIYLEGNVLSKSIPINIFVNFLVSLFGDITVFL